MISYPHAFNCPNAPEPEYVHCGCGEELHEFCSTQYCEKGTGAPIGCGECLDENENNGTYICDCKNFNSETETIYTTHGTDCVAGCSECVARRFDWFIE